MSYDNHLRFRGNWSLIEPENSQEELVLEILKQGEISFKKFDPFEDIEDSSEIISRFAMRTNQDIIEESSADFLIGWNKRIFHSDGEISVEKRAELVEFIL